MVCSPEQARLNGAKSKGAVTERGKAIASRNATKHGLLAQHPPLLITEDLSTFEGLVQGLIDYYQPENPVEHFLIQQIAMGMLKQHRLWSVEAAIANIEILKAQRSVQFPDHITPPALGLDDFNQFTEKRTPRQTLLEKEQQTLQSLVADLTHDLAHVEKQSLGKLLIDFMDSIGMNCFHEDRSSPVWQFHEELETWLTELSEGSRKRQTEELGEAIARIKHLVELATKRLDEITESLRELGRVNSAIQQEEATCKGVQNPELFARYQRELNRDLYEALDRLEAMQERKIKGSMGSFRHRLVDESHEES